MRGPPVFVLQYNQHHQVFSCQNQASEFFQEKMPKARIQKNNNGNDNHPKMPSILPYHCPGPFLTVKTSHTCLSTATYQEFPIYLCPLPPDS